MWEIVVFALKGVAAFIVGFLLPVASRKLGWAAGTEIIVLAALIVIWVIVTGSRLW